MKKKGGFKTFLHVDTTSSNQNERTHHLCAEHPLDPCAQMSATNGTHISCQAQDNSLSTEKAQYFLTVMRAQTKEQECPC